MKNHRLLIVVMIIVIIGASIFLLSTNKNGDRTIVTSGNKPLINQSQKIITAKQAYPVALAEAKKFSIDSYLVDLNTSGVQKDGKSKTWYVFFYSPSKKTNFKVNVVEGKVEKTDNADKNKIVQIPYKWIDSDQVAQSALPKCGEIIEDDYFIDLDIDKDGKTVLWNFRCTVGEYKTLTIDINASTGEYIKTRKAGIGW